MAITREGTALNKANYPASMAAVALRRENISNWARRMMASKRLHHACISRGEVMPKM